MIQEKRLTDLFCQLVRIDAPSLNERAMADQVKHMLSNLGCRVEEDQAGEAIGGNCGNLIAYWPGEVDKPPILFGVHLDTVGPCLGKEPIIGSDQVIRSNGQTILGADDLSGLAAILEAMRSINEDQIPHRPVEILASVAEELHLKGSHQFDFGQLASREAYVLDTSGSPGAAALQAPGHVSLTFEIFGQAAHAGIAPETGISAIQAACKGISGMKLGRIDAETTANIGRIEGGGATNIVADYCLATSECRSLRQEKLQAQAASMRACMEQGAAETGARVSIKEVTSYHPYQVNPEHPVVGRFVRACAKLGLPGKLSTSGGGSDNNVLMQHGIAGIVLTCGMQQVHSCSENISILDLVNTARLVEELIRD
jgi:tripeptide aminopeptidase